MDHAVVALEKDRLTIESRDVADLRLEAHGVDSWTLEVLDSSASGHLPCLFLLRCSAIFPCFGCELDKAGAGAL